MHINKKAITPVRLFCNKQNSSSIYLYMRWFTEAWQRAGGKIENSKFDWPYIVKVVMGRFGPAASIFKRRRVIVLGSHRIESVAWPIMIRREIIPMMWDLWPENIGPFVRFVRRDKIKLVFCTSSYGVRKLTEMLPGVQIVWVPEGIDVCSYPQGDLLRNRPIDILSYGRQNSNVMSQLEEYIKKHAINVLIGDGKTLLFPKFCDLVLGLQNAKVVISYPKSISHPEEAGSFETLTQRYWEAMLTGTLIVGHAPQELVELCGYNPVIELGETPCQIIDGVLADIEKYQPLVDKNRQTAEAIGSWDSRVSAIMEVLK